MTKAFTGLWLIFILVFAFGCSKSISPISPSNDSNKFSFSDLPVGVSDRLPDGSPSAGMGTLGLFELSIDPQTVKADLTSLRSNSLADTLEVVDITSFLSIAPCTDCVKLKSIGLDNDGNIVVSIGIRHPFPVGDPLKPITGRNRADLHVFNVEGIVISKSAGISFPGLSETISGCALKNADGFTKYLDPALDEIYPTGATIHPYILHFDNYSQGNFAPSNPMGFASVTDPPPSGNLVIPMGCDYDFKDYIFDLDPAEPVDLILAVGCTYALCAATKSDRFTPEYRIPQHNKKAASEVRIEIVSDYLKSGDITSTAQVRIKVVDINNGVTVGTNLDQMLADSSVGEIKIDLPGVMTSPLTVDISSPTGSGHDASDPLVYNSTITNSAGATEGRYEGLVKVLDTYLSGQNSSPTLHGMDGISRVDPVANPLDGLFDITEFATWQTFSIDVGSGAQIVVVKPNGGEEWRVGTDHEITWTSDGVTGTIFIEYSKDNFQGDVHPIASDEEDDGSFMWENIPDDPSDTVRVRISSTDNPATKDISDNDFKIISGFKPGWARTWGAGSYWELPLGFSVDSVGNSCVAGQFMDSFDFDPGTGIDIHYTNGSLDAYVSKFDTDGNFKWARSWGGASDDNGFGADVDDSGNVYVVGRFQGTVDFDTSSGVKNYIAVGSADVFLTKFDSNGNWLWARTWGSAEWEEGWAVCCDGTAVYVVAEFRGTDTDLDPTTGIDPHTSQGDRDVSISKLDSDGNFLWARTWGGAQRDRGCGVACNSSGDIYITCNYFGPVDFDPGTGSDVHTGNGMGLSKLKSNGDFVWARTWGAGIDNYGEAVAINPSQDIFVVGRFSGTVDFDPDIGDDSRVCAGVQDIFLSKFNPDGGRIWTLTWGTPMNEVGYEVGTDLFGNVCITGWMESIPSDPLDFDPGTGVDGHYVNNYNPSGPLNRDPFLINLDSDGNYRWGCNWGATRDDEGWGVQFDAEGYVYCIGYFYDTVDFDPGTGVDEHTSNGYFDCFLSKFNPDGAK